MSKHAVLNGAAISLLSIFLCVPALAQGELGGLKGIGGMGGGCKGMGGMGGGFKGIGGMGGGCKGMGGMGGGFRGVGDAGGGFDSWRSNSSRFQDNRYGVSSNGGRFGAATSNNYGYRFGGERFGGERFENSYGGGYQNMAGSRFGEGESAGDGGTAARAIVAAEALQRIRAMRQYSPYCGANPGAASFRRDTIWQSLRRSEASALQQQPTVMPGNPDSMGGFRMYSQTSGE